jgi:hypothetical protein
VFNRCIPNNVVEWAIWNVRTNIPNAKFQVWSLVVALRPTNRFAVEIDYSDIIGPQGVEVVSVETVSTT